MESLAVVLFVVSACVIVYVTAGYPLLLAALARVRERPVRRHLEWRKVSIVLAVRNGEKWIGEKLRSIQELDYPRELLEIVVVSNGSEDRTEAIVCEFADERIRLLRIPESGKAEALNAGMRHARGEILFFTDVRQRLDPACLRNLVACFGDPWVGAVSGELIICDGRTQAEAYVGLYWRYEKWIRRQLSRIDSAPGASGCVYAMRRALATPLPAGTLLDDVYLPLAAFFRGYRVILDETARAFDYPTGLGTEFRRKVRTLAGVYQIIRMCPALLGPSNRMWFHFVSHKLGRLLLPYALLAMAAASFGLPGTWAELALLAQGVFYGLALLDVWVPENSTAKRVCSLPRAFVVLMAAALAAALYVFVPRKELWKETTVSTARPAL